MTPYLSEYLYKATANTFEMFAFVSGCRIPHPANPGARLEARVRFEGPVSGRLVLRAPDPVLEAVTGNILGALQPADALYQEDTLGELANIICGSALVALQEDQRAFRMGCPVVAPVSRTPGPGEALAAAAAIELEVGLAEVELLLQADAPSP